MTSQAKDTVLAILEAGEEFLACGYEQAHREFTQLLENEQQDRLATVAKEFIPQMIHYVDDHFEAFRLLMRKKTNLI